MNCLEFALNEWDANNAIAILYDGDHVICQTTKVYDQNGPCQHRLAQTKFLPLKEYGLTHLMSSFDLSSHYSNILKSYLKQY